MKWTCKLCPFSTYNQRNIRRHYTLKHGHHSRFCPLPCIFTDCFFTFRRQVDLNRHLFKQHGKQQEKGSSDPLTFQILCALCSFCEHCNLKQYLSHLRSHLKNKETVKCPYQDCSFQSTVYSTFTGHLSRYHSSAGIKNLRLELVRNHLCENGEEAQDNTDLLSFNEPVADVLENVEITDEVCLQRKLASLFLRMQTLLHVSKTATQEIIDEFYEVSVLTGELSKKSIEQVLSQHNISLEPSTFTLIADTLDKSVPLSFLSKSGELGTEHKRASFFRQNVKIIEPVEYFLDSAKGRKEVHVPLLPVLTELLNRDDVLDKALDEDVGSNCGFYKSFLDGKYFQENIFFSAEPLLRDIEQLETKGVYIERLGGCVQGFVQEAGRIFRPVK
ncbi:uncharacterized protein LOC116219363 [Clupea harengus]|uniref:Uncharacterized protein LOC116219363 n=1 Tax=Clupea harengus TaxID=7950 RepID=A0A6P8F182_CLUHA|nr:uncharacterized protein LOC116219363 [Clupea harengus]